MPWDPHLWRLRKGRKQDWAGAEDGLQKSQVALQGTGKLAFIIVPSWGEGTGPFYPHINQSLHVGRPKKRA